MTKIKIEGTHLLRDALDEVRPRFQKAWADGMRTLLLCTLYGCVYTSVDVGTPCTRCGSPRPAAETRRT